MSNKKTLQSKEPKMVTIRLIPTLFMLYLVGIVIGVTLVGTVLATEPSDYIYSSYSSWRSRKSYIADLFVAFLGGLFTIVVIIAAVITLFNIKQLRHKTQTLERKEFIKGILWFGLGSAIMILVMFLEIID